MEETKIIYHLDEQETPYLIKVSKSAGLITLLDLKTALNRFNYKYFFKSMDDDFGVVKEEIADDKAKLPSFNGRIITWLVSNDNSCSDVQSQQGDSNYKSSDNLTKNTLKTGSQLGKAFPSQGAGSSQSAGALQGTVPSQGLGPSHRPPKPSDASSSILSSDLESTSFFDSDDDTNIGYSASSHTASQFSRGLVRKKRHKKQKIPVLSQASSFSSITDSTMSLNIVSITLNMDTASFLGISIVGQSSRGGDGGIYVGSIMKGGAVAQDGRIEPGDMILEVNGISFENMSNDEAVRMLREAVQKPGPITLVVAKCWDPNPRGYTSLPQVPQQTQPLDPSAWVLQSQAMMRNMMNNNNNNNNTNNNNTNNNNNWGAPSVATSSVVSSIPPHDYVIRAAHSSATSSSSHSSRGFSDLNLTKTADMSLVAKVMSQPDSGLEVKDRMWLKIPIPKSFIGSDLVDWLFTHVEGFADRRDARRYACNLLKNNFIQHTVNKISFSEQCYYVFNYHILQDLANLSLADDIDSVSSIGIQPQPSLQPQFLPQSTPQNRGPDGPLPPPPSWVLPSYNARPTFPLPPNVYNSNNSNMLNSPSTPYNYVNEGNSYMSVPGYNAAESVISSVKQGKTCNCLVTHTYKQIKKLWDNNENKAAMLAANARGNHSRSLEKKNGTPLLNNKFDPDIEQSTNSESESGDSNSSQSKESKGKQSKQTTSSSTTKTLGLDSGLGSGERSLPPIPSSDSSPKNHNNTINTTTTTSNNNSNSKASSSAGSSSSHSLNQQYKLSSIGGSNCADETLQVMGDL